MNNYDCQYGLCLLISGARIRREVEVAKTISRLKKVDYLGIIIACVLAIGILATILVVGYLRKECEL